MNFRGLIIAVVVLGALGGVLYWSQHRKPPEEVAPASTAPVILKVNVAAVNQITIKQKTPVTLEENRVASGRLPNLLPTPPIRRRSPACSRRCRG